MANWKRFLVVFSLILGSIITVLLINTFLTFCTKSDVLEGSICITDEGEEYEAIGAFETTAGKWIIWVIVGLSFVVLMIYIFVRLQRGERLIEDISEKKEITGDEAEIYISQYFLKKSDISYTTDNHKNPIIPSKFIHFYRLNRPFLKTDREHRVIKQFEILQGIYSGVYTTIINLAKDKDWILNGDFFWENTTVDKLIIDETKYPYYQLRNPTEMLYERLERIGATDLIDKLQRQEMEKTD